MLGWVVVYGNPIREGQDRRAPEAPAREAALSRARSLVLAGHKVHRIEGPQGEVINKDEIERWMAANPK